MRWRGGANTIRRRWTRGLPTSAGKGRLQAPGGRGNPPPWPPAARRTRRRPPRERGQRRPERPSMGKDLPRGQEELGTWQQREEKGRPFGRRDLSSPPLLPCPEMGASGSKDEGDGL